MQLPKETSVAFKELGILAHLRSAGITKNFGYTCSYLFQVVFTLVFHNCNWYHLCKSKKAGSFPAKDAIYRFLNYPKFAWRKFLLLLSAATIQKVEPLTSDDRFKVLIVDDSMYERNRSNHVELLARLKDHARNCYYKGFRMLTLGWSDGHSFVPVDFALLSSTKSQLNVMIAKIDKRTSGYKRRAESLLPAPTLIPDMIDRALSAGIIASYVLMDSWFTYAPLISNIKQRGLDVIGMVKADNKRYLVGENRLSLNELYYAAARVQGKNKNIIRSIRTQLSPGIAVHIVFVRHRTQKKEWVAILSTDLTLTVEEMIQIYNIRWDIEVFFKCTKSLLKLQKEFQGRSYDMLISHTTIIFSRYIMLSWQHRQNNDHRSLGGMFYELCTELNQLDWAIALQELFEIIEDVAKKSNKKISKLIKSQLNKWIDGLPQYIRVYLPELGCES